MGLADLCVSFEFLVGPRQDPVPTPSGILKVGPLEFRGLHKLASRSCCARGAAPAGEQDVRP
jgi:hypothetical protein